MIVFMDSVKWTWPFPVDRESAKQLYLKRIDLLRVSITAENIVFGHLP